MKTSISRILAASLLTVAVMAVGSDKPVTGKKSKVTVAPGRYACVFSFGGTFFDSQPIVILDGNRYQSARGEGAWEYQSATGTLKLTGALSRQYASVMYVPSGKIPGGLKNKSVPALLFKPSAAHKKERGQEAVPQFCYLESPRK